ncbi:MAG: hypothetical protein ACREFY_07275 [Acetobacteraceae bacterium]
MVRGVALLLALLLAAAPAWAQHYVGDLQAGKTSAMSGRRQRRAPTSG